MISYATIIAPVFPIVLNGGDGAVALPLKVVVLLCVALKSIEELIDAFSGAFGFAGLSKPLFVTVEFFIRTLPLFSIETPSSPLLSIVHFSARVEEISRDSIPLPLLFAIRQELMRSAPLLSVINPLPSQLEIVKGG